METQAHVPHGVAFCQTLINSLRLEANCNLCSLKNMKNSSVDKWLSSLFTPNTTASMLLSAKLEYVHFALSFIQLRYKIPCWKALIA